MKYINRILILVLTLFMGLTTLSAQTVQVIVNQKVPALPSTAISYLENPLSRYFNIQFIANGVGSEGLDIFFDMDLTVNTSPLYVRTRPGTLPLEPIHIYEGLNQMSGDVLNSQVLIRTETNFNYSNILNAQQLPEGTYTLCVDIYRWSDKDNPSREPINIGPCPTFVICYSGSAPELVSPMAGSQLALNGAQVVTPNRKINFFWTPVIANCSGRNVRFNYKLKVVKVLNGQNYQDAIKYNPTVLSTMIRNNTCAVFDTLRDIKVQMEPGALYVAQVQAEQIKTRDSDEDFIIANEGVSQPMPFFWSHAGDNNGKGGSSSGGLKNNGNSQIGNSNRDLGENPEENPNINPGENPEETPVIPKGKRTYGYSVDEEESEEGDDSEGTEGLTLWEGGVEEESGLDAIMDEIKTQYLASFIQDDEAISELTETYPDEWQYVPTPKRRYVESDGYYTVPMTDDLEVSFMPNRHGSLKDASYTIELYKYDEGDIDSITASEPLLSEKIEAIPEKFNKIDSHELISRTLNGWGAELEESSIYYLQLSSSFKIDYWNYSIADTIFYVNEMMAEHIHDTVSREFVEDELTYANGVVFQWGDDPNVTSFTTPQWNAPVNRTNDDIYDPANYKIPAAVPEVKKAKTFPISWTPVKGLAEGDEVEYEVNVYELISGQTVEQAIASNEALVTRTITDDTEISEEDTKFFKVFSPKKTYVMTLSVDVTGDSEIIYHFENGNNALPIIFKVVK